MFTTLYDNKGLLHCDDGPAFQSRDYSGWYFHGKHHRLDGPARLWIGGYHDGLKEWWINGKLIGVSRKRFTQQMFEKYVKLLAFV